MGFLDFFSKFRGERAPTESAREAEATDYNGYSIIPAPQSQSGQFLAAGRICKTVDGNERTQTFVRADAHSSWDEACATAVLKARRIIDEQGDNLFKD